MKTTQSFEKSIFNLKSRIYTSKKTDRSQQARRLRNKYEDIITIDILIRFFFVLKKPANSSEKY